MNMSSRSSIIISDLSTGYSSGRHVSTVTSGINASLIPGELTCLLGPNGAGKSTLLKTLSGFLRPLSGNIIINGRNITEYSDHELAKVIGVVLTERIHIANMSVEELVALGRSPYTGFFGRLSLLDRKIVDEAIKRVGIEKLRTRMIHTLSDGERQKAMIAKALAQETPVIFLDEPTAFIDYPGKVEIMQLLAGLCHEGGKTVFLSTHDVELALQIADRIWLIDKAEGVRTGSPEDLSLSGDIAGCFHREGVRFDPASGQFMIDTEIRGHVNIKGSGLRAEMVGKALKRRGISVENDNPTDAVIEIYEDAYRFDDRDYTDIASIVEAVSAFFDAECAN